MDDPRPEAGCYNCERQATDRLPPRDAIVVTEHWRVTHAFNVTLRGWLVLVPTTHLTSFAQLSAAAAAEFGVLVRRLSQALEAVTACEKTYLMQFSEAEGYAHLHAHLVPRRADHRADAVGPNVFAYMTDDQTQWLPETERDTLALALRRALAHAGATP